MRCYYHDEVEAVAICKSCLRGLCRECCVEVGHTSACRNRCEPEVETLNALLERNKKAYRTTSSTYYRNGVFMLVHRRAVHRRTVRSPSGMRDAELFRASSSESFSLLYGVVAVLRCAALE